MLIKVIRKWLTDKSSVGEMFIDGDFICYTLEDKDREVEEDASRKIKGETAIPLGKYRVIRNMSARFKRMLPRLLDVFGFEGILIHPGNTDKDTEGCILLGMTRENNAIGQSRNAFAVVDALIKKALDAGEKVTIEITRDTSGPPLNEVSRGESRSPQSQKHQATLATFF
jgi:hypothetical protein